MSSRQASRDVSQGFAPTAVADPAATSVFGRTLRLSRLLGDAHVTSGAAGPMFLTGTNGSGKSMLLDLFAVLLGQRPDQPEQELGIGSSRFRVTTDTHGRHVLHDHAGRRLSRNAWHDLLQATGHKSGSVLRPSSQAEEHTFLESLGHDAADEPEEAPARPGRLIGRAAVRFDRQIRQSSQVMTVAALWRRLIRAAVRVLRQVLRLQRRQHARTPEAASHSHTVDQHRTRGPNCARTTSPLMIIREPAPR